MMKKKRILRLVCLSAVIALLVQAGPVSAQDYPYVGYATDSVRLRRGPSYSADILRLIKKGDAVLVTGAQGNYSIVEYEGLSGYVVSSFLSDTNPFQAAQPQTAVQTGSDYVVLTNGSQGAAVKALQQALEELGFYTKAIDSKYGSGTESAVKAFQDRNKLTASGIADAQTQQLIFEGEPLNNRGKKIEVKTLPPIPRVTIYPGDRGDAVVDLQQQLTSLGLYKGKLDGEYGSGTQDALKAFQSNNHLKVDGVVGKDTQAKLASVSASQGAAAASDPAPITSSAVFVPEPLGEATYPYNTTSASSVNLRKRASTSSMRLITVPEGASVQVLEDAGNYLKVTYRSYTGYVVKDYINIPEQYLDGKALQTDQQARINYETLTSGAEGRTVRALQQALAELGFYQGSIDGKFGAGTTTALKAFQKQNGLRQTGIALPELQLLLYEKRVRNNKNRLVYAKTLPPIDGIDMAQGDYGDAVYELHQLLTQAGFYDKTLGYEYTQTTSQAVRAFQKAHSIKQTGKADSFTMLALRTSLAASQREQVRPGVTAPAITQDTVVTITTGTTGLPVTRLQARLVELGYYSITPDGVFNSDDIAALRQFQRVNGLTVNGIGDLPTQQTLYASYAIRANAQIAGTTSTSQSNGLLKIGSSGDQVRAMQSRLITLQYLTGKADGIFGTQTAAAVTSFQRTNSLKADGIAGSQTLTALYDAKAIANTPKTTEPTQSNIISDTLNAGSTGSQVTALQQRLIELRYLEGNADGIYGPRTVLAVQAFQKNNSLKADGIAGKLTMAKLMSSKAIVNGLTVAAPAVPTPKPAPVPPASTFTPPKASEVRNANWYTEIRPIAQRLRNVIIYDFISGKHYNFRIYSLGKHADGTTLTKEDTSIMEGLYGKDNWTPRPVWVIFSDGRVYMASTHSHGHEVDYISDNGLTGHLCIHFPREMDEAALTGPYAVSHQNAILAGWDLTKNMAR